MSAQAYTHVASLGFLLGHSCSSKRQGHATELVKLIRRIQALTLELAELRQHAGASPELRAKEHTLDQLRWRLASVARRTAADDLGAAA